jgi:hypothetical protein
MVGRAELYSNRAADARRSPAGTLDLDDHAAACKPDTSHEHRPRLTCGPIEAMQRHLLSNQPPVRPDGHRVLSFCHPFSRIAGGSSGPGIPTGLSSPSTLLLRSGTPLLSGMSPHRQGCRWPLRCLTEHAAIEQRTVPSCHWTTRAARHVEDRQQPCETGPGCDDAERCNRRHRRAGFSHPPRHPRAGRGERRGAQAMGHRRG